MTDATQPGRTPHAETTQAGPMAVLLTADRFLAAYLTELHPGVTAVTDTSDLRAHRLLAGATTSGLDRMLDVGDGLLVLADAATSRTVYISGDLDDAGIWARAATLGAALVAVLPDGERWLRDQLSALLGNGVPGTL